MSVSLELIVGAICSLMGIAVGYTVIVSLLAGIQLLVRHKSPDS